MADESQRFRNLEVDEGKPVSPYDALVSEHVRREESKRPIEVDDRQGPVQPEENMPTLAQKAGAEGEGSHWTGERYDYSHHLPESLRGHISLYSETPRPGQRVFLDRSSNPLTHRIVAVQASTGTRWPLDAYKTRSGHNLERTPGLRAYPQNVDQALHDAMSQHLELAGSGRLQGTTVGPAKTRFEQLETNEREAPAGPEELMPKRLTNPWANRANITPHGAKIVPAAITNKATGKSLRANEYTVFDYTNHLSPHFQQKGYSLRLFEPPKGHGSKTLDEETSYQILDSNGKLVHSGQGLHNDRGRARGFHATEGYGQPMYDMSLQTSIQKAIARHGQLKAGNALGSVGMGHRFGLLETKAGKKKIPAAVDPHGTEKRASLLEVQDRPAPEPGPPVTTMPATAFVNQADTKGRTAHDYSSKLPPDLQKQGYTLKAVTAPNRDNYTMYVLNDHVGRNVGHYWAYPSSEEAHMHNAADPIARRAMDPIYHVIQDIHKEHAQRVKAGTLDLAQPPAAKSRFQLLELSEKKAGIYAMAKTILRKAEPKKSPTWLDKHPILSDKDIPDLELAAATHEFGHKKARPEAEADAHKDYVEKHRQQAMMWHVLGMKMAHVAGDMEAAAKHGAMYKIHAEALGHSALDKLPDHIAAMIKEKAPKIYKFRAHRGDLYALDKLGEKKPAEEKKEDLGKAEKLYCTACKDPLDKDGHCKMKSHWEELDADTKKGELKPTKKRVVPCVCPSYKFPHRHKSGACGKK